ncbi:amidohydrolase [Penicillium lagena]|uniref:amidohydrolase n=1 Tax=Penicillium lagena TaxID=94218 RepID=UPI002541872B|nr:amidohydrolase [Penicillium lagena]KAJ5613168.1 amidohydrolase [Penicillium lagena]
MESSKYQTKPWKPAPPRRYVFCNANLVDPVSGRVHSGVCVHVADGLVQYVGQAKEPDNSDAAVIDLEGKYLCPGLTDCHVHLAAVPGESDWRDIRQIDTVTSTLRQGYVCESMLHRGFTTVRDCGGATLSLKESIADGLIHGPRLFIAGRYLSQTGGHGDMRGSHQASVPQCCGHATAMSGIIADGVPACLQGARDTLRTGSDFIKIMGSGGVASPTDQVEHVQFTDEEIRAITSVARNANTYVTSHAYTPASIQQAIRNGVTGIEHGNLIDEETAALMAEKGVYLTPTLVTYSTMAKYASDGFLPPESAKKNDQVLARGLQSLRLAADAGVTMCFGTDLLGHLVQAQSLEFGLRAQVLSPLEVLRSATINPAQMMGQESFLGQIKEGFAADLLVLNANPLEDIKILEKPETHILAVMKEGRVYMSRWSQLMPDVKQKTELLE